MPDMVFWKRQAAVYGVAIMAGLCGMVASAPAATTQTGGAIFQYAAFATSNTCGAITLTGNSSTDSFDSSQGTYSATRQKTGGNIGTNGNIRLTGNVDVYGSASSPYSGTGVCASQSPTAVTSNGNVSISGGGVLLMNPVTYATPPPPSPAPPISNQNISGVCGSISGCSPLGGSKNLSLAPGSYGNLSVSGNTTIHLQAGTYTINSLSLSGKSDLVLDSTPVVLNFAGQGLSGNDTGIDLTGGTVTNTSGKPSGLEIIEAGTAGIKVPGGADTYGFIYAPNAPVVLDGGAQWYGAIIAATVTGTGNSAIHYDRALGNAALAITANPDPAPNTAGWNNTNVTVSFTCSGILITFCSSPVSVTTEGANQQVSGTATDIAGDTATVTVAINLDKTPPTVTTSRLPASNAAGWNNTNVTVSFVGNDALSGVAACTAPITLTNEGRNQSASGTCTDFAGNVSPPATVTGINIDKTPPTLAFGAGTPAANAVGWNNTNVSFPFTTADNLSGVGSTSSPNPLVLTAQGAVVNGTVTVTDLAGNSATFPSPSVKIDKTPPVVVFGAGIPAANTAGWNNTNVNVSFTATDALSGLASTSTASPLVLTAEGSAVTGSVTVTDMAGNTATYASPPVKIDKTPPAAQAAASPQANAAGWNNTNVTVSFTGTDVLSGIASCSMAVVLNTEGRNQSASGTCTDNAGNPSQPATISGINIDKTPPTLTFGAASPPPNAAGWNNSNVAFSFTTADNLSGVASASVPSPLTLATEGASVSGTVTVTDVAGNSATFTSPIEKIDKTPPTLTFAAAAPPANAAGWNNTNVSFAFTTADNLSGVASTSIPSPLLLTTEGTAVSGSITVTDVAGNTGTVTSPVVKIEKTLPIAQAAASPQANAAGWNNTNVTVSFTGANSISGIASCSAPVVLSMEGRNQSASGTCTDNAGNVSPQATVTGINIDKTPPTLTFGAASPPPNAAGWNNTNVAFSFTTADNLSGVSSASVPSPLTLTTEGASVSGTVTVTDVAGNIATFTSPVVKIDETPPTLTFAAAAPAANAAGWNNTNVSFGFTTADNLSGVASTSTPSPLVLTSEGTAVSSNVTVRDVAGNTATFTSPLVKIEKTLPTAQATASPPPNAAGWNNTNVTVSFTGSNSLSGIASCSAPMVLSTEGRNQSGSGTCTDNAGNVSPQATVTGINIDKTPPTIVITSPGQNAILNTTTAAVTGTAADALSGVATVSCNALPAANSAGGFSCTLNLIAGPNVITVQATDVAGNTATANINVTIQSGPAALSFTVQPGNVSVGQSFLPAVQVTLLDANGQVLAGANLPVTISLGATAGGAILSGTLTQNAQNGVATFSGLSVNKAGKGDTLIASSSGATATSSPFDVVLSPAQLAACVPASSQSVLVQGGNVSAYVPNGNWLQGGKNVQLVPVEGNGTRATIVTPSLVTACASNWVTGQTVCTANNTDVYLIKGSMLTNTLTSGSNTAVGFPFISGGACKNCGVTINAATNQAVIAMGLIQGAAGIQILDLNTNTFANPISSNGLGISEAILVDPNLNLVLAASETGHYGLFDLSGSGKIYDYNISRIIAAGSSPDSSAEDCTTGIALAAEEDSSPPEIFLTDLTQAKFDPKSSTWTAPAQSQVFPEFFNARQYVDPTAIAVASQAHLGIATSEFGRGGFGVIQLPSSSGSGTPAVLDYAAALYPTDPSGQTFYVGGDPHTVSAYVSPNDGKAYGVVPTSVGFAGDRYLAIIDLQGILNAPRSSAHIVDPGVDLLKTGLLRFVPIGQSPAQLAFISQPPQTAVAGQAFVVKVAVEDAQGNVDNNNTFPITVTVSPKVPLGSGTFTAVNGVVTFQLAIQPAGTFTLSASTPALSSVTSNSFTITPAPAAQLSFVTQPVDIVAGQPFPTIQVGWLDQFGNPTPSNLPVTLSLYNASAGVALSGTTSVSAVNGVASFTGVTLDLGGFPWYLLATGKGASGSPAQVVSGSFRVTSAAGAQLVFLTQPGTASAGQLMSPPTVAIEDAFGNIAAGATNTVTLSLGANPSGATLSAAFPGSLSVKATSGIASFYYTTINYAGVGYTIVASSPGFPNATSLPFNISGAGPPVTFTPASIKQGTTVSVTITTPNTHFQQGVTTATFGPGLMVGGALSGGYGPVTVTSPTSAVAQVSASANATAGLRTVVLQTGAEQDTYFDAFEVVGTPFLFSISPGSGSPGQTVSVTIKGQFTNFVQGTTQANFGPGISVGGGPQGGYGPVTVTDRGTAVAQITIPSGTAVGLRAPIAVQTGAEQASLANGGFLVLGTVTGLAPVISFASLTEGMEITAPTAVTGTITSPNLSTWTLDYAPSGSNSFTTFATGTSSTVSGTLDPTLLLNGMITVRLTAMDQSGQTTSTTVNVVVTRKQKVGNFTLSFTDLNIPVAGIPIQIVRTYDSRDKTVGDFGIGWSLSVKSVRVDVSGIIGKNWTGTQSGGLFSPPTYCIQPGQNYVVSVRLQSGTIYQFQPVATDPGTGTQCAQILPPQFVDLTYVPIGSTPPSAQLSQPNSRGLMVTGSFPGALQLQDPFSFQTYGTGGDTDQWILTMPGGQTVQVSVTFGVQAMADRNGNTINIGPNGITSSNGSGVTFNRDGLNRITAVRDPNLNLVQYSYDGNGNLSTFTDQRNNISKFTYDAVHNLISFIDPTGAQPIRNDYDDSGRLIQQIDAMGHVQNFAHDLAGRAETFTDFLGNTTTFVYDNHGNIIRGTDALGNVTSRTFDANDNILSETNPLGKTTSYTYDANNNRLSVTDPLGNTTRYTYNALNEVLTTTDANGNTTKKTYDHAGNLLTLTDALGNTTTNTYTNNGLPLSTTDPMGNTTQFAMPGGLFGYDSRGNLLSVIDPLGTVTSYTYDANNNRISQTLVRTTASGRQTLTMRYQYDQQNRLVKTIFPDGSVTQAVFNALGKQSATIDELGRQTSYSYDADRRLVSTTYADGTSETNTYDAIGNKVAFTDRSGATTTYTYDPLHRMLATTNSLGAVVSSTYDAAGQKASSTDALGNVTRYGYDDAGRQTSVNDALSNVTQLSFDADGRQTSTKDAAGHVTTFRYDAAGRPTQVTHPDGSIGKITYNANGSVTAATDAAGKTTLFAYDSLRRLASVTDALGGTTKYAYDELGNRVSITDANGHITRFQYDQRGHRINRMLPGGQNEAFAYDPAGELVSHTDFNGKTTTYQYDSAGRLLSKAPDPSFNAPPVTYTYTALGKRTSMTDVSGTATYSYDAVGRLTSKQSPAGNITYGYDIAGNLISLHAGIISVTYAYDPLNRPASVTEPATGTTSYKYNPAGTLQTTIYPNGVVHAYSYDSLNRLTAVGVNSNSIPVASYSYTLDPTGHRLSVAEFGGRTVNYAYDVVYRLTGESTTGAVSGPSGTVSYTYDAVGNRTQTASTLSGVLSGAFSYDGDDRLADDVYDAAGNTVSSGGIGSLYDFENRLIQRGSVSIVYDGDGNRVSETAGGVTTKYLIDALNPTGFPQVIAETSSDGSTRTLVYGLQRISQRQSIPSSNSSTISFYIYDGHGSVRSLANPAGAITDTYDYDAFGNLINRTGTTVNNYLFAGEQFDPAFGIYYNRARYYDERRGRFWTMDALEGSVSDPLSLHKYLYVRANPVSHRDPSGNEEADLEEEAVALEISAELEATAVAETAPTFVGATHLAAAVAETELATGAAAEVVGTGTAFTGGGAGLEVANTALAEAEVFIEAHLVEVGGELVIEITEADEAAYLYRLIEAAFSF